MCNMGFTSVTAQVVSDFGFFGRKKAEDFLGGFENTYCLRQLRLSGDSVRYGTRVICLDGVAVRSGAMQQHALCMQGVAQHRAGLLLLEFHLARGCVERRILRSFPGAWQVHVVNEATGEDALLTTMDHRPSYAELQELLLGTPGSNSSKGWAERLRQELQFNNDSLKSRG